MLYQLIRRSVRRLVGDRLLWQIRRRIAERRFYGYLDRRMRGAWNPLNVGPNAPPELVLSTAVLEEKQVPALTKADLYFASGYSDILCCLSLLERYSFNIRTLSSVLELGVGSARILRHLRCISGVRLVGTDVSRESVQWCKRHVTGCEFYVNDVDPPLSFAESNSFDLIIAWSVFTHIPPHLQRPWLSELRRVLRPGGFLLCNVLGPAHQELMLTPEERARLACESALVLDSGHPRASFSTKMAGSWDVFQSRGEILKNFSSVFEVLDYIPAPQVEHIQAQLDFLVLQNGAGMGNDEKGRADRRSPQQIRPTRVSAGSNEDQQSGLQSCEGSPT